MRIALIGTAVGHRNTEGLALQPTILAESDHSGQQWPLENGRALASLQILWPGKRIRRLGITNILDKSVDRKEAN